MLRRNPLNLCSYNSIFILCELLCLNGSAAAGGWLQGWCYPWEGSFCLFSFIYNSDAPNKTNVKSIQICLDRRKGKFMSPKLILKSTSFNANLYHFHIQMKAIRKHAFRMLIFFVNKFFLPFKHLASALHRHLCLIAMFSLAFQREMEIWAETSVCCLSL